VAPSWRRDARELFYLTLDGALMSVAVEPGALSGFASPRKLFDSGIDVPLLINVCYVPAHDGQRFLLVLSDEVGDIGSTKVMLHWPAVARE
jgi:hypothetical protein